MLKIVCLAVSLALAVPGLALAQSAKFSAVVSNVTLIPMTVGDANPDWKTVDKFHTSIKTPNKKDLLIGLSLETGLLTDTTVKSKNGQTDTSTANASLEVRLLIDNGNTAAFPDAVVYDKRIQKLSASLTGLNCTADLLNGGIVTCADPEVIELLLSTMAAHHFNFVAPNLTPGTHLVEVQVRISTTATTTVTSAMVEVGRGSLTVEEVRATNSPDGITFTQ